MKIVGMIPARMASTRFPNKPLARILGIPMIGHVYFRSKMSDILDDLYVATCDQKIYDYILSVNGKAIMTAPTHERATDRIAEALTHIEKKTPEEFDIAVLIQGDEPMIFPEMINQAVQPMIDDITISCVNLMSKLKTQEEHNDQNEVKVVVDRMGYALYFSREPIPSRKKTTSPIPMYKQVCIIPFRRDVLFNFNKMKQTPLETVESIDMLRFLENGYKVKMIETLFDTYSVDTVDDLKKVEKLIRNNKLVESYRSLAINTLK